MTVIAYATDIHGDVHIFEKLFREAEQKRIKAILIGGDVFPEFDVVLQRAFIREYLIPRLTSFQKRIQKPVYLILGNDDFMINIDLLEQAHNKKLLFFLHNKVTTFETHSLIGYGFVNRTPFHFPDWEKDDDVIFKELMTLAKKQQPEETILVAHVPPSNSKLDVLYDGSFVGSSGIRQFIETWGPHFAFFGHIHESPEMSGAWKEKIGKTLCINPGNGNIVIANLHDQNDIRRISKF
ncbi:MAG: metallophosphoesterase [Nanoarchaeota archaeon]|nr:metallophosphoesterase [Nanoarchaeota archaeon]